MTIQYFCDQCGKELTDSDRGPVYRKLLAEAQAEIEGLRDQLAQQSIDLRNAVETANEAEAEIERLRSAISLIGCRTIQS